MSSIHQRSLDKPDVGRLTHKQEKNQSIETDPEMTEMMEAVVEDVLINIFHTLEDLKESMNRMREKMRRKNSKWKRGQGVTNAASGASIPLAGVAHGRKTGAFPLGLRAGIGQLCKPWPAGHVRPVGFKCDGDVATALHFRITQGSFHKMTPGFS